MVSGQKDIAQITSQLEELGAEIREENLSLDGIINVVARAHKMYKKFQHHFGQAELHVRMVQRTEGGVGKEEEFDWRALYGSEEPGANQ